MKQIEDMTLNEIRELKEKYRDEFKELVKEFLGKHPDIDHIWLYERSHVGLGDSVRLEYDDLNAINDVVLKGEKI